MTSTSRRQAAARGLSWRHEWLRYVIRCHGAKANVITVAAELMMLAHNEHLTTYSSAAGVAAVCGKGTAKMEDAHAILVRDGFLTPARGQDGRQRRERGCKVWMLTAPAVVIDDRRAVAAERRTHEHRDRGPDEDPPVSESGSPRFGTRIPPIRNADPPDSGGHTVESTGEGTDEPVQTSVVERARERDASGPLGAPCGDASHGGPRRTDGDDDPAGSAAAGPGASAATPDDDESATSDREETTKMTCNGCGALSDAPLCDVCDPDASPDAVAARTVDPGGERRRTAPGGHSPDLPAPAGWVLAALELRSPLPTAELGRIVKAAGGRFPAEGVSPLIARDLGHYDQTGAFALGPAVVHDNEVPPDEGEVPPDLAA